MRSDPFDDNRSAWLSELPPYERAPALAEDVRADVAVIGGGLTGVSTAWHLSERFPDRRIVLLEARALANGASGRNGGQVLNGVAGLEPDEPEAARRLYAATRLGIDIVERLAGLSTLDAGFARHGCLEAYTTARSAEAAQARVERWRAWGLDVEWLPAGRLAMHGAHGAALDPTAGRANTAALLRGLRPLLQARGIGLYEQTPVTRIREGATVTLETPRGAVRAPAVVLGTNAYTPQLGYFRAGIVPLHSHVVATAPLSASRWAALGWGAPEGFSDDLDRIAYGCRPPDEPVAQRWTGPLALTFDRVCSMGVTGAHRNVYYALGYCGHGLALAALAGRVLSDLYAGEHEPWQDLPFYQRRLPYVPPDPLRWIGYQLYTRLTGRSPRRR